MLRCGGRKTRLPPVFLAIVRGERTTVGRTAELSRSARCFRQSRKALSSSGPKPRVAANAVNQQVISAAGRSGIKQKTAWCAPTTVRLAAAADERQQLAQSPAVARIGIVIAVA